MNYYKRHLGDYAKDTKTISIYEHGVYTVVLDYYYSEEGPVSDEDVEALCRPQNAKEKLSVDKVMRRYFKRDGALWRHSYADRVIADWQEKSAKAAESADKRWHSERNANASAPAMPPQSEGNASHKPLAISQETERPRKRGSRLPQPFALSPEWNEAARVAAEGMGKQLKAGQIALEFNKFCDHWWGKSGKDATKEDWLATWRNWVRRAIEYGAQVTSQPPVKIAAPDCAVPGCKREGMPGLGGKCEAHYESPRRVYA